MNLELGRYSGRRAKWSAFMETCSYMECGLANKHRTSHSTVGETFSSRATLTVTHLGAGMLAVAGGPSEGQVSP